MTRTGSFNQGGGRSIPGLHEGDKVARPGPERHPPDRPANGRMYNPIRQFRLLTMPTRLPKGGAQKATGQHKSAIFEDT
jgi:hypothetical protein